MEHRKLDKILKRMLSSKAFSATAEKLTQGLAQAAAGQAHLSSFTSFCLVQKSCALLGLVLGSVLE
jgi:hypothetical protein